VHPNIFKLIVSSLKLQGYEPYKLFEHICDVDTMLDQRVPAPVMYNIWETSTINNQQNKSAFPLSLLNVFLPQHFHQLGTVLSACASIYDALQNIVKYSSFLSSSIKIRLTQSDTKTILSFYAVDSSVNVHKCGFEAAMILLIHLIKTISHHKNIGLTSVSFKGTLTNVEKISYENYLNTPVFCQQPNYFIAFDNKQIFMPLPLKDLELKLKCEQIIQQEINQLINQDLKTQVIDIINVNLSNPNIEVLTANQLNISVRTLQRNLNKYKTNFNILLINCKLTKAKELLTLTNKSIKSISYELGFKHPSSFTRVFKSNTKYTPQKYRQHYK